MKLSIDLFNPKIQKEEVDIDTTVQENKNVIQDVGRSWENIK